MSDCSKASSASSDPSFMEAVRLGIRSDLVPPEWVRCPVCNDDDFNGRVGGDYDGGWNWCECCLPSTPDFDIDPFAYDIKWHLDRGQYPGYVEPIRAIEHALLVKT